MSVVILQDEIVHYEVLGRGSGKPLFFLHGWVGSWRYWIPTMQAASTSFRTYAIDLWGFGDTSKFQNYYSLEQQVNLLDQFMDKLGIGRIALIGHGLGAIVGLMFAERFKSQSLVDRLMAIGLPDGYNTVNARLSSASTEELADWLLSRSSDSDATRSEAFKADQEAIQVSMSNLSELDMLTLSRSINIPCLMVYGQNDPAIEDLPFQDQMDTLPQHIHQIVFEDSGHFPMLDEPSKFNRLLTDFLSLSSGTSPRQLQIKEEWKRRIR